MSCEITIEGHLPRSFGITKTALKLAAKYFASCSSKRIKVPFHSVTIILQDDNKSDEVHRGIMGVEGATDVITQAYEAMPPEPEGIYGELYVNTDQALRFAKVVKNWSSLKELLLYIAHGMDHLSGADDLESSDRDRMRRRELKWLKDYFSLEKGAEK